jgi:hypothetical protein
VDDFLSVASFPFNATDELTVWAGVNMPSDHVDVFVELSFDVNANNGAFGLYYNSGQAQFYPKGQAILALNQSGIPPILSIVFTCEAKISSDSARLTVNQIAPFVLAGDMGPGNFITQTQIYSNAREYQMIVRNKLSTTQEIADTKAFVNSYVMAY